MNHVSPTNTRETYAEVALDIGKYLAREAIWDGDACNWLGSTVDALEGKYQVVYRTFSMDQYNGTAGIAIFLSRLYLEKKDEIIWLTIEGCINQILRNYENGDLISNYGYYGGKLGVAYALIQIGKECSCAEWEKTGWEKMEQICKEPFQSYEIDVISGLAGAVPVFLRLFDKSGKAYLMEAAARCGNQLIAIADKTDAYWNWKTLEGHQGLTGYSHGAAGIGLAFLELFKSTQNPDFHAAAMMAFAYERSLFNPQVQNWPDLRTTDNASERAAPIYGESWCHGAPGIALSRLRAWQLTGEDIYKGEAEVALATTYRSVYGWLSNPKIPSNFSLCHGLAGNAECLLVGGQILGLPQYVQVAVDVANFGIEKFARNKFTWPSGVNDPTGVTAGMEETPGLMLGLAGTGYYYLRVSDPGRYPSVLLL